MRAKTWFHQWGSPRWFFEKAKPVSTVLGVLSLVFLSLGIVWGLGFAPEDYQQGNSFRIMYVHVPSALLCQSLYLFMGIAGFIGLVWRMKLTDVAISAAIPLGMMLTAVALITGSLWGRPTWGTWWEWDGRTVSTLVLFFLYFGIYALRQAIKDSSTKANATAIIAMVGTLNIPIIKYSVDWWHTLHQPAPFTITEKPAMPSEMWLPLLVMVMGFYCFAGHNVISRMRIEILRRESRSALVKSIATSGEKARYVF